MLGKFSENITYYKYSYKEVILPWSGRANMAVMGKQETAAIQVTSTLLKQEF